MIDNKIIKEILSLHFDADSGTPYWLDQEKFLGLDAKKEIRCTQDFHLLGPMDINALRSRPLTDFIPRSLLHKLPEMILSETGGTTGPPCRRVFTKDEFYNAFISAWLKAVEKHSFPKKGNWLFVGPGGPHIIAHSAREMARSIGSLEPFSVDCDVRWFRKQEPDSLGFTLYLDHVLDQAVNIISTHQINTIFTTPILLSALGERMTSEQRQCIQGIHTGGMAQDAELTARLKEIYSNAVILPGYGNSLFGVIFERNAAIPGEDSVFFIEDPPLWLQLVPLTSTPGVDVDLKIVQPPLQQGRVVLHRLDPSFLIINLVERDGACYATGSNCRGLMHVRPLQQLLPQDNQGVY
jgi:thienamycin biosynthesis protein ThnN